MALTQEAESLPIHVQMCALRHRQLVAKIDAQNKLLKRIAARQAALQT
jgi:hypothetical protein